MKVRTLAFTILVILGPASRANAGEDGGGSDPPAGVDPGTGSVWAGIQTSTPPSHTGGSDGNGCRWIGPIPAADGGFAGEIGPDGTNLSLFFDRTCPGATTRVLVPVTDDTDGGDQLEYVAASQVTKKVRPPQASFQPPSNAMVVNIGTWFWTTPGSWQPVTAHAWVPTADASIDWVQATATPATLTYDPGARGGNPVTCHQRGVAMTEANRWQPTPPDACRYTYRHPTKTTTATLTITWNVTWTSNRHGSGTLPNLTTDTTHPVTVDELQAVITR